MSVCGIVGVRMCVASLWDVCKWMMEWGVVDLDLEREVRVSFFLEVCFFSFFCGYDGR